LRVWPLAFACVAALGWWLSLAMGLSALLTNRYDRCTVATWCKTQVARYLPGGIWAPIVRASTVRGRLTDKLAAVGAENVIVLALALAVGGLWATLHNPWYLLLCLLAPVPLLASRRLELRTAITRRRVAATSGTYALGYICYGLIQGGLRS